MTLYDDEGFCPTVSFTPAPINTWYNADKHVLNPGNVFLYGPGTSPGASYLYVLDAQALGAGAHVLSFTVQGDPVVHSAGFALKK
jgi:hypothetical protein